MTLTVDLGGSQKLTSLAIAWEFPAKAFAVSVSSDGVKWTEVFATDSNLLASTEVSLGAVTATKVRVIMHEVKLAACQHEHVLMIFTSYKHCRRTRSMASSRVCSQSMHVLLYSE